jgi:ribosomal protein RSM22 (predicted rRNA methylase)
MCAALESAISCRALEGISSHLDLFSGPGTAVYSVRNCLEEIRETTCIEKSEGFVALAQALHSKSDKSGPVTSPRFITSDLLQFPATRPHDLVTIGYAINELSADMIRRVIQYAWDATVRALVIVEPGTPAGYAALMECRDELLRAGAWLAAPCPHSLKCPLLEMERWCHFSVRLPRGRIHREIKGAGLGYEDEKFCYLVAVRQQCPRPDARIIGFPHLSKRGVELNLCTSAGENMRELVTKRDRERYRLARHSRWGDPWPASSNSM